MRNYDVDELDDFYPSSQLVSACCGARPWGEVYDGDPKHNIPPTGICSNCRDHATFEQEIEE